MSDAAEVRALIAEARYETSKVRFGSRQIGRVALSSELQLIARLADALEAAQVPATDDEREALWAKVEATLDAENHEQLCACPLWPDSCSTYGQSTPWSLSAERAFEVTLNIARRSARVPVSRDELAAALDPSDTEGRHLGTSHEGVVLHPRQARAIASRILASHDIYPKADRKPADSSNGDDRG